MDILKELSIFNRIVFLDRTHTYLIDNKPSAKYSVTGLLESLKEPFEKEKWATIKGKEFGLTSEEIIKSWDQKNLYSKVLGTVFHNYAENYFNNKVVPYDREWVSSQLTKEQHNELRETLETLLKQFNNFYNDTKGFLIPIKNELVIGDVNNTKICGMIDMLCYNTKKECYEIYDFKTNKEINYSSKFKKKFLEPLNHLEVCEYNTYSLQLGFYKKFIEDHTSIKIENLYVLWLNKKNENYQLIPLLNLNSEVDLVIQKFTKDQINENTSNVK
jgi:hypothetical protein